MTIIGPNVQLDDLDERQARRERRKRGITKPHRHGVNEDFVGGPISREAAREMLRDLCDPRNISSFLGQSK